jgi:hypothetical protein
VGRRRNVFLGVAQIEEPGHRMVLGNRQPKY